MQIRRGKYKQHEVVRDNRKLLLQGYEPQALKYLLAHGFDFADLKFECEGVPTVRYLYAKKHREYRPDIYCISKRLIIEVKSEKTFGLLDNTPRGFSMNCAKALACHNSGFKYVCLILRKDGTRVYLPKNWPKMKKQDVLAAVKELNPLRGTGKMGLFQM